MGPRFVHLHVHSHYSFLHAVGSPGELVREAARSGMTALALTDHLGLWGTIEFYRAARAAGVKPIVGCEVRVRRPAAGPEGPESRPDHLLLLARDRAGYENLVRLVSRSYLHAARDALPAVAADDLAAHGRGLFAIAPTLSDGLGRLLLEGNDRGAAEAAAAWRDLFGGDRFFLEVSDHGLEEERRANRALRRLAADLGVGLVAGNDVHYPRQEDAPLRALVGALAGRSPGNRPYIAPCRAPLTGEHWLKPPEAMATALAELPEAIRATLAIAEACTAEIPLGERHMPPFPVPRGADAETHLRRLAEEGLRARLGAGAAGGAPDGPSDPPANYTDRLDHELQVISGRGLATYFLVFWDLCRFARERGIPIGPGRGSAAGSLTAYALGITGVDPLRHGLVFERFLNPDRPGLPDIDLDVDMLGRDELIEYLFRRYGPGRVCRAGTVSRFGPRGAVRAAAEALKIDPRLADRLAKLLPERADAGLARVLEAWPEFRALPLGEEPFRTLVAAATHLEGAPRYPGTHPAGIVLGGPELERPIPVHVSPAGEPVAQYAMDDVDALGFVKLDVLGLRNLTIVEDAVGTAGHDVLPGLTREGIPLDDPAAWNLLARGETVGCFQLESPGIRRLLRAFAPRDVDDLAALLSLYRPGPLDPAAVASFLKRRRGEEAVAVPHPFLAPVLAETHGILLYQEQVMQVAVRAAGFSLGEADGLRRALEHPEAPGGDLADYRERFLAGARARGLGRAEAERVFAFLERFAGYSFCKAHSTPYALISCWTAFLKARCPAHYFAALLTTGTGYYAPWVYVAEARRAGSPVVAPDVNRSIAGFRAEPDPDTPGRWGIRPGLLAVRGVGAGLARRLLEERLRGGPYRSLADLAERLGQAGRGGRSDREAGLVRAAPPKPLDALVHSGFLDALGERSNLPLEERMAREEAALGWAWSGPLLAPWREALDAAETVASTGLGRMPRGSAVAVAGRVATAWRRRTRKGSPFIFLLLHDGDGMIEVTVPPDRYARLFPRIDMEGVLVRGRLAGEGGEAEAGIPMPRVVAEEMVPLAELTHSPTDKAKYPREYPQKNKRDPEKP